jgi:hypothetical protein
MTSITWGHPSIGEHFDDVEHFSRSGHLIKRIVSLSLRTGWFLDSLSVTYELNDGSFATVSHGGAGGEEPPSQTTRLSSNEAIVSLVGRSGWFIDALGFKIKDTVSGAERTFGSEIICPVLITPS